MSKVTRITDALAAWALAKTDANKVKLLLEQGSFFLMDSNDEKDLSAFVNNKLYTYLGVENDKIIFILVPDSLDNIAWQNMTPAELDAIKLKEYKADYGVSAKDFLANLVDGPDVTVVEALRRHHRWQIAREAYINAEINHPQGLLDLMVMPYANLKAELSSSTVDSLCFSFGLDKDDKIGSVTGYFVDMIAWTIDSDSARGNSKPLNKQVPCPPYLK